LARADTVAIDRNAIEAALLEARGSVTEAARRLGLKNRFALYRLMKRNGIAAPGDEGGEGGEGGEA
jgi:transcriptional regulator with GAF, ATPase, and Fis domain